MKIMVTGGAGFIGSHVVDLLIANGHQVVVVDNLSTGKAENLNPSATFYQIDIRSPQMEEIFEKERPEVINHHAAQMNVRRSMVDPIFDADVNIVGSIKLLELSVKYQVRKFIHISSGGAVYGEPEYLPCDEDHPIRPLCPYGASKYAFELYLYLYKQNFGLDYTIIRYPNVYGPRQDPNGEAGVVAIFCGLMLRNQEVVINGSGEQMRDFVYVADCAYANLLALERGSGKAYNLGCGKGTTVNEIFHALAEIIGYTKAPKYGPPKAGETFRIYLNANRARQDMGWEFTVPLSQGLQQTVRYFQNVGLSNGN